MSGEVWYYSIGGNQAGPVNAAKLKELAGTGEMQPTDLVWKEGQPSWVEAATVKGLFGPAGASGIMHSGGNRAAAAAVPDTADHPYVAQRARPSAAELGQQAKAAGQDAVAAIKILMTNPVGGIGEAHEKLGPQRAMLVGALFVLIFYIVSLISIFGPRTFVLAAPYFGSGFSWSTVWRAMVVGLVPAAGLILGCFVVRKAFKGQGTFASDVFISGASLLPMVALILVSMLSTVLIKAFQGLAGDVIGTFNIFAISWTVLMLNSGVIKIFHVSERVTALAVPILISIAVVSMSIMQRVIS